MATGTLVFRVVPLGSYGQNFDVKFAPTSSGASFDVGAGGSITWSAPGVQVTATKSKLQFEINAANEGAGTPAGQPYAISINVDNATDSVSFYMDALNTDFNTSPLILTLSVTDAAGAHWLVPNTITSPISLQSSAVFFNPITETKRK